MEGRSPAFLLVELVVLMFRMVLELALRLGIVSVEDEFLEVLEAPREARGSRRSWCPPSIDDVTTKN